MNSAGSSEATTCRASKLLSRAFKSPPPPHERLPATPDPVPYRRDRLEDIPHLASHFLHLFAAEFGVKAPTLQADTLRALQTHDYPGNVRELRNLIERALIRSGGQPIQPHHLDLPIPAAEAAKASFLAGGMVIFKGPLKDNGGKEILPAGAEYKQQDLALESMSWLVDGVLSSTENR